MERWSRSWKLPGRTAQQKLTHHLPACGHGQLVLQSLPEGLFGFYVHVNKSSVSTSYILPERMCSSNLELIYQDYLSPILSWAPRIHLFCSPKKGSSLQSSTVMVPVETDLLAVGNLIQTIFPELVPAPQSSPRTTRSRIAHCMHSFAVLLSSKARRGGKVLEL